MSILDTIKPIELRMGTHKDVGKTGQGCIMNVIAYLNGEDVITDQSPCVHPMLRGLAIEVNDMLLDKERQEMLPMISKLMGSVDTPPEIVDTWVRIVKAQMERELNEIGTKYFPDKFAATRLEVSYKILREKNDCRALVHQLRSLYLATASARAGIYLGAKLGGLDEAFEYAEYKKQQEGYRSFALRCKNLLAELLSHIPDNEAIENEVVQGRATQLATVAKSKVAVPV